MANSNPSASWKPGESGNKNGRPKKGHAIADILNDIGEAKKNGKTRLHTVLEKQYKLAENGDLNATKFIADRTEGRSIERIQTDTVDSPWSIWMRKNGGEAANGGDDE